MGGARKSRAVERAETTTANAKKLEQLGFADAAAALLAAVEPSASAVKSAAKSTLGQAEAEKGIDKRPRACGRGKSKPHQTPGMFSMPQICVGCPRFLSLNPCLRTDSSSSIHHQEDCVIWDAPCSGVRQDN